MSAPPAGPSLGIRELGKFLEIQNLGLNLPFALAFLFAAARGLPRWNTFLLVIVALLAARNAGHAFNRWTDRALDAANPRTLDRALVTGRLSAGFAIALTAANAAILVGAAALLNPLALALAPVALVLVLGYSYTKRYTSATTVVLGLVEALVPAGVFIAVTGTLPEAGVVAVFAILAWGTAFETVHSLGDVATDERLGLFSLPRRLGVRASVTLVAALHAVALVLFALFGILERFTFPYTGALAGMAVIAAFTDIALARHVDRVRAAFERHFLLASIFLIGVALSLSFPGLRV